MSNSIQQHDSEQTNTFSTEAQPAPPTAPPIGADCLAHKVSLVDPKSLLIDPVANADRLMNDEEYGTLKADIAAHGQLLEAAAYHGEDGQDYLIEGRNRCRACEELGIPLKVIWWEGKQTKEEFVRSMNRIRRHHPTKGQLALKALREADALKPAAEERMRAGKKQDPPAKKSEGGEVSAIVGKTNNVSAGTVKAAKRVKEKGVPELTEWIEAGRLTPSAAEWMLRLPTKEAQAAVVAEGIDAVKAKIKELREHEKQRKANAKKAGAKAGQGPPASGTQGQQAAGTADQHRETCDRSSSSAGAADRKEQEPQAAKDKAQGRPDEELESKKEGEQDDVCERFIEYYARDADRADVAARLVKGWGAKISEELIADMQAELDPLETATAAE